MRKIVLVLTVPCVLYLTPALGYVGPGVGAGTIAIVLGVISSIFFGFLGILWYPFKRLLKRMRTVGHLSARKSLKAKDSPPKYECRRLRVYAKLQFPGKTAPPTGI